MPFTRAALALVLLGSSCTRGGAAVDAGATAHFRDESGKPLEQLEPVWPALQGFFGDAMPPSITVASREGNRSRFHWQSNRVVLTTAAMKDRARQTVAHETSHVCLGRLTGGASTEEPFRFLDEGLARIIEEKFQGDLEGYKARALRFAQAEQRRGLVSLEKVQRWSRYFENGGKPNWRAYDVGASFDFYLLDAYGWGPLRRFFVEVGKTRSLESACQAAFGRSAPAIEKGWLGYLSRVETGPPSLPRVVRMLPSQSEVAVSNDLAEAEVEFDVPMSPKICVVTSNCDEGFCYRRARWKTDRLLVLEVNRTLLPRHRYRISLGSTQRCRLASAAGDELPITTWEFETR